MAGHSSTLVSTPFSTLDQDGKNALAALFEVDESNHITPKFKEIYKNRRSIDHALTYYQVKLGKTNPAGFIFFNRDHQLVEHEELLFTYNLLVAQFILHEADLRYNVLLKLKEQIELCERLLKALDTLIPEPSLQKAHDIEIKGAVSSAQPIKYLALTVLAPFIAAKVVEFTGGNTELIKEWMGVFNARRLYWVWGGGMLSALLNLISDDFYNKPQLNKTLNAPAPTLGYISWILYYTRFGINLFLFLKRTLRGPWMSEEEKQIPALERFKTQWHERKFTMLNDSVWATVNLVTFFWLIGEHTVRGIVGYWLTAALLVFDVCLAVWRLLEESTKHNAEMEKYRVDINALRERSEADPENKLLLEQLGSLTKARDAFESAWADKKIRFQVDLAYAIALSLAFLVVCASAMLTGGVSFIVGFAGAALCFTMNFICALVNGSLDVSSARKTGSLSKQDYAKQAAKFISCVDEKEKKLMYLEMKHLVATSDYQERMVVFYKLKLIRNLIVDVLVPPIIFVSLMFLPLGAGLGILAGGFALALIAHLIIKAFEPKARELPEFDEAAYKRYAEDPTLENLTHASVSTSGHFVRPDETKRLLGQDDDLDASTGLSN